MRRPRFNLVLVGYRLEDTRQAMLFCASLFAPQAVRQRILVLNRPELLESLGELAREWQVVLGSNSLGEFSGWQEGLDRLERDDLATVFMNDTVATHRVFSFWRKQALRRSLRDRAAPACIGFIDFAGGKFSIAGKSLDRWVSTYCFALTRPALDRLSDRVAETAVADACVRGGPDEASFFADLSPDLVRHMVLLLFRGGWYASRPLTNENSEFFRYKAKCVIAEKVLSARCLELGIALRDPFVEHPFLWLADKVEGRLRWEREKMRRRMDAAMRRLRHRRQ